MAPKRHIRKTNPVIFVFCEGDTEKQYIDLLRLHYRVPVQIIPKILCTKVSQRLIDATIKNSGYPTIDKIYLFYDGDRQDIVDKLYSISNAQVLLSCPCIELWFLLHFTNHNSPVTSEKAEKLFLKHSPSYQKGIIHNQLNDLLISNRHIAVDRAKKLIAKKNPSSTAYLIIEFLDSFKK